MQALKKNLNCCTGTEKKNWIVVQAPKKTELSCRHRKKIWIVLQALKKKPCCRAGAEERHHLSQQVSRALQRGRPALQEALWDQEKPGEAANEGRQVGAFVFDPCMPTVPTFAGRETDVSRHIGGTIMPREW